MWSTREPGRCRDLRPRGVKAGQRRHGWIRAIEEPGSRQEPVTEAAMRQAPSLPVSLRLCVKKLKNTTTFTPGRETSRSSRMLESKWR